MSEGTRCGGSIRTRRTKIRWRVGWGLRRRWRAHCGSSQACGKGCWRRWRRQCAACTHLYTLATVTMRCLLKVVVPKRARRERAGEYEAVGTRVHEAENPPRLFSGASLRTARRRLCAQTPPCEHSQIVSRAPISAHVRAGLRHAPRQRHEEPPLGLVLQQFAHRRMPRKSLHAIAIHPS